jgi:hypothetical protein
VIRRAGLAWLLILGLASSVAAQTTVTIQPRDASTGSAVPNVGNTSDNTIRVHIIASDVGGGGGTSSSYGSAFPASGTAAGYSDGTNMQGARVVDADTGGGTVYVQVQNLVRRASGGPVELIGQATMANSVPVVIASDQGGVPVTGTITANAGTGTFITKGLRASTATLANVAASASNVTLLASNASRIGATIYNDSTVAVFVKLGATASATSFTVKIDGGGFYAVDPTYTGIIDGIWGSASGSARLTEW